VRNLKLVNQRTGPAADAQYGIAVCDYQFNNYTTVVNNCIDIVNNAAKRHPGTHVITQVQSDITQVHTSNIIQVHTWLLTASPRYSQTSPRYTVRRHPGTHVATPYVIITQVQ